MKLSDFTLIERNIALDGHPCEMGYWKPASKQAFIATGTCSGKKYQLKLRGQAPRWYMTGSEIREKERELRACRDELAKERLQSELDSLCSAKASRDSKDALADEFLAFKNATARAISRIGNPLLAVSSEFWKESIPFKGDGVYCLEAAPWLEEAVGFSDECRLNFRRDFPRDRQYRIIASLARNLADMHKAGIVHGDLKIGNTIIVKVGDEYKAALIDFDCSYPVRELQSKAHPFAMWQLCFGGTYFSPETDELFEIIDEMNDEEAFKQFDFGQISEKSDIFSLAVTIYEYFFGEADSTRLLPFVDGESGEPLDVSLYGRAVRMGYKTDFPKDPDDPAMDGLLYGMLNWMLEGDPAKRPDAATVAHIFESGNEDAIPAQYRRINLSAPWEEDGIRLLGRDGVTVRRSISRPERRLYRVFFSGGGSVVRKASELVSEGLAEYTDKKSETADSDERAFWPGDAPDGMSFPACLRRADKAGKYILTANGVSRAMTAAELRAEGLFASESDLATPWPCDGSLVFRDGYTIARDMGRGPGNYLIRQKIGSQRATADMLLRNGYARRGAVCKQPWQEDGIDYRPESFPAGLESVVRDPIRMHHYRLTYSDGKRETLSAEEMVRRGYAKKRT